MAPPTARGRILDDCLLFSKARDGTNRSKQNPPPVIRKLLRILTRCVAVWAACMGASSISNDAMATTPVGATPGALAVSPSGAATYTIPIVVAPGTNGMQPNLSLVYNSQSGNGLLGMGWSIAGLSVIHRCGATIAIDNFKGGVNYDANDRFCLDGERLIWDATNGFYRTQHESWRKIVAYGGTPTDPDYFTVTSKDGTVHYYGYDVDGNNSRIEAQGKTVARLWALSKAQDRNGNYLTITYQEENAIGDYRPASVAYTGNAGAGLSLYNTVNFEYGARTDIVPQYEGGSLIQTMQRLTRITAYAGATLVREYRLSYDNNGAVGRSRLTSIQECGTDSVCLPPTTFISQDGSIGFNAATQWVQHGASEPAQMQYADVNGDGRVDSLYFDTYRSNQVLAGTSKSDNTGFNTPSPWVSYPSSAPTQIQYADVNGDGMADALYTDSPGNRVLVSVSSGGDFSVPSAWVVFSAYGPTLDPAQVQYADMDGDGRADLIYQGSDNVFRVALSNGAGFDALTDWVQHGGTFAAGQAQYADVNGDGKAELIFQDSNNAYWVSLYTGGIATPARWGQTLGSFSVGQVNYADVNGDGKADLINRYFGVSISTGAGFTAPVMWNGLSSLYGLDQVQCTDMNGDGKADIVVFNTDDNSIWVYLSTGNNTSAGTKWGQLTAGTSSGSQMRYADVTGDGLPDALYFNTSGGNGVWASTTKAVPPDLLTSVTDGLGATTQLTYYPLTTTGWYYKGNQAQYPYQDVQNVTYAVQNHTISDGVGGVQTTRYWYYGLKRHLLADTSLGFARIQRLDPTGFVTDTYYHQTLDGTEGTVASSETWDGGYYVRVKYVGNTWQPVSLGAGRTLAQLSSSVEETRELNDNVVTTVNSTYGYDGYGNPISVNADFGDGYKKTTDNSYTNDTANWILGQLTGSQVLSQAPGQTSLTRTSSFTYDGLNRLSSEIIEPNDTGNLKLTTSYGYDAFGNRTQKTVSGPDIKTRNEYVLTFDARGQFMDSKQNALGYIERFENTHPSGALTKYTDANNLVTTSAYDGFGRKTLETRPDNTTTAINYGAWSGGTYVQTLTSGAGENYVYHDILGRPVQANTQGFGGNYTYKETQYNNLGRVAKVSHPYFWGETVHYTTYLYDSLGRVREVRAPGTTADPGGVRTTVTAYDGLSTTVTNPLNQQKTTVKNSQGQVVSSTDAAGTVYYQYDPFGNLVQVVGVDGAVTSMTYDLRGRKIAMTDPDMGDWSYSYNALGELVFQTDANGQTTAMNYDKLGRMRTLTTPDSTSIWNYDTAAYGKGKLAAVYNTNANETYTYDNLGRPSNATTSIGGVAYITSYTYDAYSRPLTLTYPETGFQLYHVYDLYGHLTEVRQDTATGLRYWKADTFDAHGRLTKETYGNNFISQRAYDHATGDLQSIQTGTGANPASVQNSSFAFDALGNLTNRSWWDGAALRTETFGYDEDGVGLNRLTSVTGPANKTYAYFPNGNIKTKSDVGQYTYGGPRPHAVTSVAGAVNATYAYDANGNMTSGNGRTIAYTAFNKPASITMFGNTTDFAYDAHGRRVTKSTGGGTTTYIGKLYERAVGTSTLQRHFLYAGNNLVGMYIKNSNNTTSTQYFHTDHLGSVEAVTNGSGTVTNRYGYDAHGKRRYANGTDWPIYFFMTGARRGFTRHEHDDEVGLVNMNAREYDYVLGRFITPDTIVPGAMNSQSYNRYSYAYNNPLSFTDPSGQWSLRKAVRSITNAHKRVIDWHERAVEKAKNSEAVRMVVAAAAAYYTAGAASSWFLSSAGGSAFATSAFASGDLYAAYAAQGAIYVGGGIVGGAVGGATAGGVICGSDCARTGAKGGAVAGGLFAGANLMSEDWNAYGRIGTRATAGGLSNDLQGRSFSAGFKYNSIYYGAQEYTDYLSRNSGLTARDSNGKLRTDGTRLKLPGAPESASIFAGSEMYPEGSALHKYEAFAGVRNLIVDVSKVHDTMNSWMYTNGYYEPTGNIFWDSMRDVYSFAGMLPAAAFTLKGPQYGGPASGPMY